MLLICGWIFLLIRDIHAIEQRTHCPDNVRSSKYHVEAHNKTCYLFINVEKFWDEARDHCWHMGGEMLIVNNYETMKFIQNQLNKLNTEKRGWKRQGVWLGASDLRNRGWEWTTGENLKFQFWAPGEPGRFLGLLSFENCALMRRSDNWRWHDYHCHMADYVYNYICQFPFVYHDKNTGVVHKPEHGAPLEVTDDRATMIGLIICGMALISSLCVTIVFLHKKHKRQKEFLKQQSRPSIRYANTGYATIIQQSREGSTNQLLTVRPVSNMYLEPNEVTRIYEEVAKDNVNHGVNSLPYTDEARPLAYQGQAASLENMDENGYLTPTMCSLSDVTSGYNSANNIESAANSDSTNMGEYLEMSAPPSQMSNSDSSQSAGATGTSSDLKNNKSSQNGDSKCSNLYVTASAASLGRKVNQLPSNENNSDKSEMHIYTNQMDKLENYSLRPLPPVPNSEKPESSQTTSGFIPGIFEPVVLPASRESLEA